MSEKLPLIHLMNQLENAVEKNLVKEFWVLPDTQRTTWSDGKGCVYSSYLKVVLLDVTETQISQKLINHIANHYENIAVRYDETSRSIWIDYKEPYVF